MRVPVGFSATRGGGPGDVLTTSGLANCVAIVAFDARQRQAVMAHFDTGPIAESDGNAPTFDTGKLTVFKDRVTRELAGRTVQPPFVEFRVGLGTVWRDARNQVPRQMTTNLMAALDAVFPGALYYGPAMTIQFDVDAGQMDDLAPDTDVARLLGADWGTAGSPIDYISLRPPQAQPASGILDWLSRLFK